MRARTAEEKRWKAESDLNTLMEAERIRKDKGRLKAAMAIAKEQKAAIDKVEGG